MIEKLSIGHLELFVDDAIVAKEFYCNALGAEIVAIQKDRFVWIRLGAVEVLLRPYTVPRSRARARSHADADSIVTLYTGQIGDVVSQLEKNGVEVAFPEDDPDTLAFEDGYGNWFHLVNPDDH